MRITISATIAMITMSIIFSPHLSGANPPGPGRYSIGIGALTCEQMSRWIEIDQKVFESQRNLIKSYVQVSQHAFSTFGLEKRAAKEISNTDPVITAVLGDEVKNSARKQFLQWFYGYVSASASAKRMNSREKSNFLAALRLKDFESKVEEELLHFCQTSPKAPAWDIVDAIYETMLGGGFLI